MPASESFRIPKHRRHVPAARQRVRKTLADWGITDELADAVTLLANELVTNAVTHCRVSHSQVKVELTLDGRELVLEVSDPDRDRLPRPHDSTPDEEGGWGLALVAALADNWGCRQESYAKCVWARFGLEEVQTHAPATL
ncbi:ATP-binding protein [Streptomyces prunicolor]|uniref:ATP-binding protein n=1 Tax=Streptomyces prunicolor TaxID=67348 RepID=A0ABU4F5J2_9ACTN|nr:ATP-binding protein [Streptomyces prunicolor]MDV7214535.1 ATP-binding protein [Streptomyces prunicolor]